MNTDCEIVPPAAVNRLTILKQDQDACKPSGLSYDFGPFHLDCVQGVLLCEGKIVPLAPRVFAALAVLVERSGQVVKKSELMEMLWPDCFVEESSLTQSISILRKALGDSRSAPQYIETIPKRGYRFTEKVRAIQKGGSDFIVANRVTARIITEEESDDPILSAENTNSLEPSELAKDEIGEGETITDLGNLQRSSLRLISKTVLPPPHYYVGGLLKFIKKELYPSVMVLIISFMKAFLVKFNYGSIGRFKATIPQTLPFRGVKMPRQRDAGKTHDACLSPDGKYVAYVVVNAGMQSLWVRQVATASSIEIVSLADAILSGPTFSSDGNYVYYNVARKGEGAQLLYRVPVLGGIPQKMKKGVDSQVCFSPDGSYFAFIRSFPALNGSALIIAGENGGERKLASLAGSRKFSLECLSWSPDGGMIACGVMSMDVNGFYVSVFLYSVKDGVEHALTSKRWAHIGQLAWGERGDSLIITAAERGSVRSHLWSISYPDGEVKRLTNDFNKYSDINVPSATGKRVASQ